MAFPQDPNDVDIELFYDGVWNNINQYVYHRDASPIVITRGRANEGKRCDPGTLECSLNNRAGRFSPKNPASPLFGKIGRFTPIRIRVTYNAVVYTRFVGEVVSWPSRWDVSGNDVWVPLKAAGLLRRLGQGSKPIRSSLYRATAGVSPDDYVPYAYWPMEDGANATQFATAIPNRAVMSFTGGVTPAGDASLVGSDSLPEFGTDAVAYATIPSYTDTNLWAFQLVLNIPEMPASQTVYFEVDTPGGSFVKWRLRLHPTDAFGPTLWWEALDATGAVGPATGIFINGTSADFMTEEDFFENWFMVSLMSRLNAGNVWAGMGFVTENGLHDSGGEATNGGPHTHAIPTAVRIYGGNTGISAGHHALFKDTNIPYSTIIGSGFISNSAAMRGYAGEAVDERFARLCDQHRIPYVLTGYAGEPMGPERSVAFLQACRDCEDLNQGFLHEQRDALGLKLRTNSSRYNQIPISLSYTTKGLAHPLDPEPDDLNVANDREVKRRNGSSARRELTSGPMSVEDPPDGIGRMDDSVTVDAYTDDQLEHIANWRLHVGTWDSERYPRVNIKLAANAALIPDVVPLDSGDLITISDLPAWLPPGDAELLIEGYREVIGFDVWDFTYNCSPAGPYGVVGRWALLSHELHADINTSATAIDVANTDITQPMLATTGLGSGYPVTIGGEEMQLTAVAASAVTYGAVGTAVHVSNTSVTPTLPSGVASGHLLLILAAIRNSGTGVVVAPSGYTRLAVFPAASNVQIFAKIAGGSETNPTVTITGGVANATVSAQIIRLTGKWHSVSNILVGAASCLNTSAQNIAVPGLSLPSADNCIVIAAGWKADDWTSVATLSGMTEIADPSTQTGDDQGLVWDYLIQTTAAAAASTTFVVTDGGAAISRGAVFALRCDYQTATVTRSTNGVSASHSAGDDVTMTRPMRWGLL